MFKKMSLIAIVVLLVILGIWIAKSNTITVFLPEKKQSVLPKSIDQERMEGIRSGGFILGKVTNVVDGDTIKVEYGKKTYKIRLLCVDCPEMARPGLREQTYAKNAKEHTKQLVLGKQAKLIFEKDVYDKYDRVLAHVFVGDTYVNALLVRNGFARVEIIKPNDTYQDYFKQQQIQAISDKVGIWKLPNSDRPFIEDEHGNYIPTFWNRVSGSDKKQSG